MQPPPETGFTGTALFNSVTQAAMIDELIRRGYTKVDLHAGG